MGEVVPGAGRVIVDQVIGCGQGSKAEPAAGLLQCWREFSSDPVQWKVRCPWQSQTSNYFFFPGPDGWSPNIKHENSVEGMHWGCRV